MSWKSFSSSRPAYQGPARPAAYGYPEQEKMERAPSKQKYESFEEEINASARDFYYMRREQCSPLNEHPMSDRPSTESSRPSSSDRDSKDSARDLKKDEETSSANGSLPRSDIELGGSTGDEMFGPLHQSPKPWRSTWHFSRILLTILYIALLVSDLVYLYFRSRYTLKVAVNQNDTSKNAVYRVSKYSILTLIVEILCMAAMALYAVNKTYYPKRRWLATDLKVKAPFNVKICVCFYKESTETLAVTLEAATKALDLARRRGMIAKESAIWLCDDTPPAKITKDKKKKEGLAQPQEPDTEETSYELNGQKFHYTQQQQHNRKQLLANLRETYPETNYRHREPRVNNPKYPNKKEDDGQNAKSGNLNTAIQAIWPNYEGVTDRDVMFVLDADQAAFPDFLTNMLPAFDAGHPFDNVALVQSPQVFEGVRKISDVFNHINVEFWSVLMVAYNTTGFISCAGTNFGIRATALKALGRKPFPNHTVTEDFAFGQRLRAANPSFTGIYLPIHLVRGDAPDTIRTAFKQRSRWTKGPFQMMVSRESPFRFHAPEGAQTTCCLSLRDRIGFLSPVFNTLVNCLATPYFCFMPCFFIWVGRFPAALTFSTIIASLVMCSLTIFFKFFARPNCGVLTARKAGHGKYKVDGDKVERYEHNLLGYVLAEWNADINIRNFWWMFFKVVFNFCLRVIGLHGEGGGFSATGGAVSGFFDGFFDIFPLAVVWVILNLSVVWGILQIYVGARIVGPLGICIAWALYQAVPASAMLFYVVFRMRHEVSTKGCCSCYERFGRIAFRIVYMCLFIFSWVCVGVAFMLAIKTLHTNFTQNKVTITKDGQQVTYQSFIPAKETWHLVKTNLKSDTPWDWHW